VVFLDVGFLPALEAWYSGLMPYEYLLPAQLLIIVLMGKICVDFTRERGFFFQPKSSSQRGGCGLATSISPR